LEFFAKWYELCPIYNIGLFACRWLKPTCSNVTKFMDIFFFKQNNPLFLDPIYSHFWTNFIVLHNYTCAWEGSTICLGILGAIKQRPRIFSSPYTRCLVTGLVTLATMKQKSNEWAMVPYSLAREEEGNANLIERT